MGRDEHTKGSNNSKSLPQTPKNQKLSAGQMREEMARELSELQTLVKQRETKNKK